MHTFTPSEWWSLKVFIPSKVWGRDYKTFTESGNISVAFSFEIISILKVNSRTINRATGYLYVLYSNFVCEKWQIPNEVLHL